VTSDFKLLIDGKLVDGDLTLEVINPASEEVLATCARASKAQLNDAVAAAKAAFPSWSAASTKERSQVLLAMADTIEANAGDLSRLLTQEQGMPLGLAEIDLRGCVKFFRYFAGLELTPKVVEDSPTARIEIRHRPLGVVGAIVPWNYPMTLMSFKVPAALIAGNTVVLKPAPTTPLTTLRFAALVRELAPRGTLNVITDANDLGAEMARHPDIRKISFTGSTATGKKVMAGGADTLKRLSLELGGNDALIVLDDVDPKAVASQVFAAAMQNAGQICIGAKRVYVHERIYDGMCAELARLAGAAVVGDGLDARTQVGPVQNKQQFEKVLALIDAGKKSGTLIAGGGRRGDKGYFIAPTIIRDVTDGDELVDEEQFGPVIPVIRFSDPQDAVRRANSSMFGLGGSIWSNDEARAWALAESMEAGTVWVNTHGALRPHVPFGGSGFSGIGVELGEEGLREFTQTQVLNMKR
jgi:acyl-CoA reductase-like NAD-dependent aldehyde dehydrogenase